MRVHVFRVQDDIVLHYLSSHRKNRRLFGGVRKPVLGAARLLDQYGPRAGPRARPRLHSAMPAAQQAERDKGGNRGWVAQPVRLLAERLQVRVAVRGKQLLGGVLVPGGDEPGGIGA